MADDLPVPDWAEHPDSLYSLHTFATNETIAPADVVKNPHGLVLSEAFVSKPTGVGWWAPGSAFSRNDSDGTWDLGQEGWLSVTVPLWSLDTVKWPEGRDVEFVVNMVGYNGNGILLLPEFTIVDHDPVSLELEQVGLESQGIFGEWALQTWRGTLAGVMSEALTFQFLADTTGSIIDTVEIYVIPEPAAFATGVGLIALGVIGWRGRRRLYGKNS